jgi:hypothetical protein
MLVLSVYFHDLGMLVTKSEYERREGTRFSELCEKVLFSKDNDGKDYEARLSKLPDAERERFLYQEFVRANHAQRIKCWIKGKASEELGVNPQMAATLHELLTALPPEFRQDLAIVCESHHLDD